MAELQMEIDLDGDAIRSAVEDVLLENESQFESLAIQLVRESELRAALESIAFADVTMNISCTGTVTMLADWRANNGCRDHEWDGEVECDIPFSIANGKITIQVPDEPDERSTAGEL